MSRGDISGLVGLPGINDLREMIEEVERERKGEKSSGGGGGDGGAGGAGGGEEGEQRTSGRGSGKASGRASGRSSGRASGRASRGPEALRASLGPPAIETTVVVAPAFVAPASSLGSLTNTNIIASSGGTDRVSDRVCDPPSPGLLGLGKSSKSSFLKNFSPRSPKSPWSPKSPALDGPVRVRSVSTQSGTPRLASLDHSHDSTKSSFFASEPGFQRIQRSQRRSSGESGSSSRYDSGENDSFAPSEPPSGPLDPFPESDIEQESAESLPGSESRRGGSDSLRGTSDSLRGMDSEILRGCRDLTESARETETGRETEGRVAGTGGGMFEGISSAALADEWNSKWNAPFRVRGRALLQTNSFNAVVVTCTFYAVLGVEVVEATAGSSDFFWLHLCSLFCFVFLSFEVAFASAVTENYLWSFFWALDLVGTVSLLPGIGFLWPEEWAADGLALAMALARAGRVARTGTRAVRVVRSLKSARMLGVIRAVKRRNNRNNGANNKGSNETGSDLDLTWTKKAAGYKAAAGAGTGTKNGDADGDAGGGGDSGGEFGSGEDGGGEGDAGEESAADGSDGEVNAHRTKVAKKHAAVVEMRVVTGVILILLVMPALEYASTDGSILVGLTLLQSLLDSGASSGTVESAGAAFAEGRETLTYLRVGEYEFSREVEVEGNVITSEHVSLFLRIRETIPFLSLSFPSFPFSSFPFLSFPFPSLSFLSFSLSFPFHSAYFPIFH